MGVSTLVCPRCGNLWNYTGTNQYVTSCSKCKTSVSIRKNTVASELNGEALQTNASSSLVLENSGGNV